MLRAARNERVKRVVLTSSFGAVGYGHKQQKAPFDETNWTNVDAKGAAAQSVSAYIKSKTLAERAAWDFIAKEGDGLELAVVNPTGIFGPVLGSRLSGSVQIIQRLLKGAIPACPPLHFAVADVRDVADVHIRAMTHPEANGQRFLVLSGEPISMLQASLILKARLGDAAAKAPTKELSPLLLRIAAPFNPAARQALAGIGPVRRASNAKAQRVLGWTPRSTADAVAATGESLIRLGLV